MEVHSIDYYLEKFSKRKLTRARAIKLYCRYSCCVNDLKSWRDCQIYKCFLWQFRLGIEQPLTKPQSFKKQRKKRAVLAKLSPSTTEISPIPQAIEPQENKVTEPQQATLNINAGESAS